MILKSVNTAFVLDSPTKILFGSGRLNTLGDQPLPGRKALLLSFKGAQSIISDTLQRTKNELERAGVKCSLFLEITENPDKKLIMEGAAFCKKEGCDMIVALGGGAVLDASIGISAMATNPGDMWDYVQSGSGGRKKLEYPGLPVVTITTTSGTGSEINCWGAISNLETNEKIGFGDPMLNPVLAVVDPEIICSVPAKYSAYQGFDALFHNTEVMIGNKLNLCSLPIALSAIENIYTYLPRVIQNGADLEAREHMAYASTISGICMQTSSTISAHSMEHAMSAFHPNLPHGAGLLLIAKEFYRFFINKHVVDDRFVAMARVMGYPVSNDPEDFLRALEELMQLCGVDKLRMEEFGLQRSECVQLAINARETMGGKFLSNPCDMTQEDVAGIFERSFSPDV